MDGETRWLIGWTVAIICTCILLTSITWALWDYNKDNTRQWANADAITYCLHIAEPAECAVVFGWNNVEAHSMKKPLTDWQKALLFLYVKDIGLPPWAEGKVEVVLARLMDWSEERAVEALDKAVGLNYANAIEEVEVAHESHE